MGDIARLKATKLCADLREEGFCAITDVAGRSLKAQMKYADKLGAKFSIVIGEDEIINDSCILKNMATGDQTEVKLSGGLTKALYDGIILSMAEKVLK
jgi:histidyl-tRNA synthetase